MAKVNFYRLSSLPSWNASTHQGIFVNLTAPFNWVNGLSSVTESINGVDETFIKWKYGNDGSSDLYFVTSRNAAASVTTYTFRAEGDKIKGLWFGGINGWECLSNDANLDETAINNLISSWITTNVINGSTLDTWADNRATSVVNTAIGGLDATTVETVSTAAASSGTGTVFTFKGVKEADGIISQGDGSDTFTVGDGTLSLKIGANDIVTFTANATSDSSLALDDNAFEYDDNKLKLKTNTALGVNDNKIATMADIASLSGAMHYKGAITVSGNSVVGWPASNDDVKAGDVYIATDDFVEPLTSRQVEAGDMIVFNSADVSNFTLVQSNMTLGVGNGQVAKNDGALTADEILIGTANGIASSQYTLASASSRALTISEGTAGADGQKHSATLSDSLTIFGVSRDITAKFISSDNSLIIEKNSDDIDMKVSLNWLTNL